MLKFKHRLTGTEMWVADDRYKEYLEAGHIPAFEDPEAEQPAKKEQPKKRAAKKKK